MNQSKKNTRKTGALLYMVGIFLGILLFTAATWADFEAAFYDFLKLADEPFSSLSCPVFMTTRETGKVTATINNPTDRPIDFNLRTDISNPGLFRSTRSQLPTEPGETGQLSWEVSSDDVVLGNFIFAKVFIFHEYQIPSREGTCGILVFDLPVISGGTFFWILLLISIISIFVGLGIWERTSQHMIRREEETNQAMKFLAIVVLLGMLFSFRGFWLLGILALTLSVLLISTIIYFLVTKRPSRT